MAPGHGKGRVAILLFCTIIAALLSAFFCYYTVRLAYLNIAVAATASRRGFGMLIGAIAFPTATLFFAWIAWQCARSTRR